MTPLGSTLDAQRENRRPAPFKTVSISATRLTFADR
jgi:hypothetical protein